MKERLSQLMHDTPSNAFGQVLKSKKNKDLHQWVLDNSTEVTGSLAEKSYYALNQPLLICENGNQKKFLNFDKGYGYCGNLGICQCARNNIQRVNGQPVTEFIPKKDVKCKIAECHNNAPKIGKKQNLYCSPECKKKGVTLQVQTTMMERYGVDHPMALPEAKEKQKLTCMKNYGVDNPAKSQLIIEKIKQTNLERYGSTSATNSNIVKDKMKATSMERYGVDNYSSTDECRSKVKQTMVERFGAESCFQSEAIKEKIKSIMVEKYGVSHTSHILVSPKSLNILQSPAEMTSLFAECGSSINQIMEILSVSRSTILKYLHQHGITVPTKSTYEQEIRDFLDSIGVTYIDNTRTLIPPLEIDFYIPSHNLAIEFNGSYWHTELSGKKDRLYHLNKTQRCNAIGVHLIHISEHEWLSGHAKFKSKIKSCLGLNKIIYGRKTKVEKVGYATIREFLEDNHIQGSVSTSFNYVLYHGDEMVACMTFGKSRYNKKIDYELVRFCSKAGVNVVGGASKLFKAFIRDVGSERSVISYSDVSRNNGKLYEMLGFSFSHRSAPSYTYTKDFFVFESRLKYQRHKLPMILKQYDETLTAWQNMSANGYDRFWDCGTDVWIYNFKR